jgi:DNA-binding response OmpR family regulator
MKDILIVEDGRQERERLEQLFGKAGYSVVACESVADAEKALNVETFRLAVLDIGLSDKSGSYLFNAIKRRNNVSYIMIFTGNPSVHLKQRFMDEGAVDYIVKGSPQAQNESFITRVKEVLGEAQTKTTSGLDLEVFLTNYVSPKSRALFNDSGDTFPECAQCGGRQYIVTFSHQAQVPPEIQGLVVCTSCGKPMDPEVK